MEVNAHSEKRVHKGAVNRPTRRHVLSSLGTLLGCGAMAGCGEQAARLALGDPGNATPPATARPLAAASLPAWNYTPLDPAAVAETAYRIYPDGGCMYAVVGSVMTELGKTVGEPFRSFPYAMMRYGDGGIGGWGTLCGVVNGAAALIGLFHAGKEKELREAMITELCAWYETASLPRYQPAKPQWAQQVQPSAAGSLLCHVSISKWCQATGFEVVSMEKKERCRRVAADGAMKIVEVLNRKAKDAACTFTGLTAEPKACIACHGPKELADSAGKMNCSACHDFGDADHP